MNEPWHQAAAIELCRKLEMIAPLHGAHVALTGGCLYKQGQRKDLDVVFYRIRQAPRIEVDNLMEELETIGIFRKRNCGWCIKAATADGMPIDFFFPEDEPGWDVSQSNEEYHAQA